MDDSYINMSQYSYSAEELRREFNETFGIKNYPKKVLVNHETYANICQFIFDRIADKVENGPFYEIALGINKGIMFKNIELILKK